MRRLKIVNFHPWDSDTETIITCKNNVTHTCDINCAAYEVSSNGLVHCQDAYIGVTIGKIEGDEETEALAQNAKASETNTRTPQV